MPSHRPRKGRLMDTAEDLPSLQVRHVILQKGVFAQLSRTRFFSAVSTKTYLLSKYRDLWTGRLWSHGWSSTEHTDWIKTVYLPNT